MDRRVISDIPVLTASISTGVELAIYHLIKSSDDWRSKQKITNSYEVRWRPTLFTSWNIRSSHRTISGAVKELARLRDASDGLTFETRY